MKKVMMIFALMFLVFGIMLHSPLVLAESNDSSSNDTETSAKVNDTTNVDSDDNSNDEDKTRNETEDEAEDEKENEDENDSEPNLISGRTKTESKSVIIDDNGCKIKIERKIEIQKGKRVEVIKKKMECPDGRKAEVQFKRENKTVNGVTKERIKYKVEGEDSVEVELEDEMEVEEEVNGTEYGLKAKLRNGNYTKIKIMPDRASEIAIARLKSLNFTVELREVGNGNKTRVAYFVGAEKRGRFLGVFKTKVNVETEIDSETGEVIKVGKPWWAIFVVGEDSDQTVEVETEARGNTTNTPDTGLTLNDTNGTLTVNESDIAA